MAIEIKGSGNKYYKVDLNNITCTCSDFLHRRCKFDKTDDRRICKHIKEALEISSTLVKVTNHSIGKSLDINYVSNIIDLMVDVLYASENILLCQVCGGYRRNEQLISNKVPIIMVLFNDSLIKEMFNIIKNMKDWEILLETDKILNIRNEYDLQLELKVVSGDEFPYSVLYNTGPKEFLIKLESTLKRTYKQYMSESGIIDESGVKCDLELRSEDEIFNYVGIDYIDPSNR